MNHNGLCQWEKETRDQLLCLNSWQGAHEALFSLGIIEAGSCQQGAVARQVSCGERVDRQCGASLATVSE